MSIFILSDRHKPTSLTRLGFKKSGRKLQRVNNFAKGTTISEFAQNVGDKNRSSWRENKPDCDRIGVGGSSQTGSKPKIQEV